MLSDNAAWLVFIQLTDGMGVGVLSVLTPPVVTDLMRGTGRFNLALGAVTTAKGLGASLSDLATGVIVDHFGFSATCLYFGVALATQRHFVPESGSHDP